MCKMLKLFADHTVNRYPNIVRKIQVQALLSALAAILCYLVDELLAKEEPMYTEMIARDSVNQNNSIKICKNKIKTYFSYLRQVK